MSFRFCRQCVRGQSNTKAKAKSTGKDEDIDNVFQRFINDSVDVSGSDMEQMNNSVWLDAQARHVDDSLPWHWIGSNQPSSKLTCYSNLFIKMKL